MTNTKLENIRVSLESMDTRDAGTSTVMDSVLAYLTLLYNRHRFCNSTDAKPVASVAIGDDLTEVDTGDFFVWDGSAWVKKMTAIWTV